MRDLLIIEFGVLPETQASDAKPRSLEIPKQQRSSSNNRSPPAIQPASISNSKLVSADRTKAHRFKRTV
jgi:hypothetical protein